MARPTLVQRLMAQAESHLGGAPAARVHVQVGALSNISPAALERQFDRAAAGSVLDGVELVFHVEADALASDALVVRVVDVDRSV